VGATRLFPVVLAGFLLQAGQQPLSLQGTVTSSAGGSPVATAQVVVARVGGTIADYRVAETDGAGKFTVRNLAAGSYRIYADRDGYLRGEHGRRLASGSGLPVVLTEGLVAPQITITMIPTGVIAGRVFDGPRPAQRVWVRALRATYFDGGRSFRIAAWGETDDRGQYRLFGLEPGAYVVSAIPVWKARLEGDNQVTPIIPTIANSNSRAVTVPASVDVLDPDVLDAAIYPAVYHPGTTDIDTATALDVPAGATVSANNLALARVQPRSVRGRLSLEGGGDQPLPPLRVGLIPLRDGTNTTVPDGQLTAAEFRLSRVPPGRYYVVAQTTSNAVTRMGGFVEIEVGDRDLENVVLRLTRAGTVTGRVRIDGRPVAASDARILVQLVGGVGFGGIGAQPVQPDGTFSIAGILPNTYRLRVLQSGRTPWVRSARFGADDVTYGPFRVDAFQSARDIQIDISTATGVLEALVVDQDQRPVAGALVVAVPDAARRSRSALFRTAATDAQGRIRLEDVVPGEYRLFATTAIDGPAWQDPAVIRRFETRGELVRLAERGSVNVTLRTLQ
jgi:hypothetical protein